MNRRTRFNILSLMTIVLLLCIVLIPTIQSIPPPLPTRTLIVDINGQGDYTSIQDAIDNAAITDIVKIREGIYGENNLSISKKITIIGDTPSNTIIDCSGENGFTLYSSYVDISNLKLVNSGEYAIYVSPGSDSCTMSNCIIDRPKSIGIWIGASSVVVSDCDIIGSRVGIKLRESNSIIKNCNIQRFEVGILALVGSHNHQILECNLYDNQLAVDIRINSNNNLISDCNIYSNEKGVYIWQSSNNNIVYHNNFFKNDADAIDECNNTWYNGTQGNYWDDYRGVDADGNGIGDTPYVISQGNTDEYPLMTMTLPDEITSPGGVTRVTSNSDNTPSFTWDPSIYREGIKGYYVKIDNNPETYIGDTISWTSPDNLSDGIHTFYVRAEAEDNTTSRYVTVEFLIDTIFIDVDGDGWSDVEEQMYGTDPNNPDNYPLDTDNDRTPDSIDTDDDNDGYSDGMETSYGTDTKNPNSYPTDTDNDGIPDENSQDGKYVGDVDDDDDSLTDTIEINLGSNPRNGLDAKKIYIAGEPCYLVDISQDDVYDILYNPDSDTTTAVEKQGNSYLIDENGDGLWDYSYNIADGSLTAHENYLIYIIILAIAALSSFIYWYVCIYRSKPFRLPRIPKRKKKLPPLREPLEEYVGDLDTTEMIGQTKNLLQNIQHDVTIYMDKLSQIEKQMAAASTKKEEEITPPQEEEVISLPEEKEEPTVEKIESIVEDKPRDLESKVDELLAGLENKEDTQ